MIKGKQFKVLYFARGLWLTLCHTDTQEEAQRVCKFMRESREPNDRPQVKVERVEEKEITI